MKCINCGFEDNAPAGRLFKNAMNNYVTTDGKVYGIINDDAESITVPKSDKIPNGLELIRQDLFEKAKKIIVNKLGPASPSSVAIPVLNSPESTVLETPILTKIPSSDIVINTTGNANAGSGRAIDSQQPQQPVGGDTVATAKQGALQPPKA